LKIADSVKTTKRRLRRERLAARAAAMAEEATADLRPAFSASRDSDISSDDEEGDEEDAFTDADPDETVLTDRLKFEKSVMELVALRRQLSAWMAAYEEQFGRKADLTLAAEEHPQVYGLFVR